MLSTAAIVRGTFIDVFAPGFVGVCYDARITFTFVTKYNEEEN